MTKKRSKYRPRVEIPRDLREKLERLKVGGVRKLSDKLIYRAFYSFEQDERYAELLKKYEEQQKKIDKILEKMSEK